MKRLKKIYLISYKLNNLLKEKLTFVNLNKIKETQAFFDIELYVFIKKSN